MEREDPKTLAAYSDGLKAAYRHGKYENVEGIIECPYNKDSQPEECTAWHQGFDIGTEDFIWIKSIDWGDAHVG